MSPCCRMILPLMAMALAGCADRQEQAAETAPVPVRFEAVSFDDWAEKLLSYPPDIVVVDMWATWCTSCLERFPHMVEMWKAYRDRGVRFVSLNLDDHADEQALAQARTLLEAFGAGFENYYMAEDMMQAFARLDLIGIPAVVIYDSDGSEAVRLTGDHPDRQFTEADVEAAILAILAGG